jgi:hypothetical protein
VVRRSQWQLAQSDDAAQLHAVQSDAARARRRVVLDVGDGDTNVDNDHERDDDMINTADDDDDDDDDDSGDGGDEGGADETLDAALQIDEERQDVWLEARPFVIGMLTNLGPLPGERASLVRGVRVCVTVCARARTATRINSMLSNFVDDYARPLDELLQFLAGLVAEELVECNAGSYALKKN